MSQTDFNFRQYFINMAVLAAKLEHLPFTNQDTLVVRRVELLDELPNEVATVIVGNDEDYQALGVYAKSTGMYIVGASQRIDSLPLERLEQFIDWAATFTAPE